MPDVDFARFGQDIKRALGNRSYAQAVAEYPWLNRGMLSRAVNGQKTVGCKLSGALLGVRSRCLDGVLTRETDECGGESQVYKRHIKSYCYSRCFP